MALMYSFLQDRNYLKKIERSKSVITRCVTEITKSKLLAATLGMAPLFLAA